MWESQNSQCTQREENISLLSLFFFFPASDPNSTGLLHTWDQTNSIFHILLCHLIDLMLLVVRLRREKEHAYNFSLWHALFLALFFFFFWTGNFIKSQGWGGPLCAFFPNSSLYRSTWEEKKETERSNFFKIFHRSGCVLQGFT